MGWLSNGSVLSITANRPGTAHWREALHPSAAARHHEHTRYRGLQQRCNAVNDRNDGVVLERWQAGWPEVSQRCGCGDARVAAASSCSFAIFALGHAPCPLLEMFWDSTTLGHLNALFRAVGGRCGCPRWRPRRRPWPPGPAACWWRAAWRAGQPRHGRGRCGGAGAVSAAKAGDAQRARRLGHCRASRRRFERGS
jgi:hypothetical protein